MEDVKFDSVRQVEDLYEKLIDIYNDVGAEYEELEAIDDDIQELRNTSLDKYDYNLMAEVYTSLGEKETSSELDEKANECEMVILDLQKKLQGVDIKEHLFKFYEMEIRKENFDIQMKACEKFLEKSQRRRELEKMKGGIRPASPRRFPNLTRVPSPRFIRESSDEEEEDYDDSDVEESDNESQVSSHTPKMQEISQEKTKSAAPAPAPAKSKAKNAKPATTTTETIKNIKKGGAKLNLLPVAPAKVEIEIPAPPPLPEVPAPKTGKGKKK